MSYDYLKGRKCMVWTFMGNSRMYQALAAYGDRLSQVGLFSFKVSRTGVITESGVAISNMLTYINRWPHIKWLLTIARLFLGDADGFSILYYQDVDSLVYWANEAAYRWGVRGFAMWSLGQEDMRLWEALPKQI